MNPFGLSNDTPVVVDPLEAEIQKSVREFEARFGAMAMLARGNGWIAQYENEIRRLVKLARLTTNIAHTAARAEGAEEDKS